MPAGRAGDADFLKVGRFNQDVGRRSRRLCAFATHHAGDSDRSGVVRDQQVFLIESTLAVVEGPQLLAWLRPADGDSAGELVKVVRVQRLTQFQHHVVGDIDHE